MKGCSCHVERALFPAVAEGLIPVNAAVSGTQPAGSIFRITDHVLHFKTFLLVLCPEDFVFGHISFGGGCPLELFKALLVIKVHGVLSWSRKYQSESVAA